jgi:hypothetical protein
MSTLFWSFADPGQDGILGAAEVIEWTIFLNSRPPK